MILTHIPKQSAILCSSMTMYVCRLLHDIRGVFHFFEKVGVVGRFLRKENRRRRN
jgi:hypothetical protein